MKETTLTARGREQRRERAAEAGRCLDDKDDERRAILEVERVCDGRLQEAAADDDDLGGGGGR
jgi:hypothetical protein